MSERSIENPAVLRRLARSQGWDCVLDATSNQGRGPLRQRFPDRWHLIERNGVRRPELHPHITISEAFRGGWVPSLFVSKRWRSPKRSRVCAQHVVAAVGHLPVLEVSEGTLRALEQRLHRRTTRYGRGLSNSLVRRAVTLTRRAVFQLQFLLGVPPLVADKAKGPRKRQGVVMERRPGSVREFSAVWEQLPNDKVRAAVALICAGATEAEVQRMQCTDLGPEGFVWLPVVGPDRSLGRWIVLPRWARPAVAAWRLRRARMQSPLLFPGRDDPLKA